MSLLHSLRVRKAIRSYDDERVESGMARDGFPKTYSLALPKVARQGPGLEIPSKVCGQELQGAVQARPAGAGPGEVTQLKYYHPTVKVERSFLVRTPYQGHAVSHRLHSVLINGSWHPWEKLLLDHFSLHDNFSVNRPPLFFFG